MATVGAVEREHRRQRLTGEANLDVRVVFEDQEVVLSRQRQQLLALCLAERVAGRVLEVRNDVREAWSQPGLKVGAQRGRVDPIGLEFDHLHVGAALQQPEQSAVVGRPLDDYRITGLDKFVEEEGIGLHRAVGDDHLLYANAVALGDPLAQRRVAAGRAITGHAARVFAKRFFSRSLQAFDVDDVE